MPRKPKAAPAKALKIRQNFTVDEETMAGLEMYRADHRLDSLSQALRSLVHDYEAGRKSRKIS